MSVSGDTVMSKLTRRQREVVRLLASGHSQVRIAQEMGVSVNTVYKHVRDAKMRAESRSTIELVSRAVAGAS